MPALASAAVIVGERADPDASATATPQRVSAAGWQGAGEPVASLGAGAATLTESVLLSRDAAAEAALIADADALAAIEASQGPLPMPGAVLAFALAGVACCCLRGQRA
ncbi:MAG: hypothetical protein AAF677_10520 [Pseudomonadota bacterium]